MLSIVIQKSLSFSDTFDTYIKEIQISDTPIGAGGFGQIYTVLSIQEQFYPDIVCKLFYPNPLSYKNFKNIQSLQTEYSKFKAKHPDIDLQGLPLFSFEGFLSDVRVYGYLMQYFKEEDYANFSLFMEDKSALQAYYNLDFTHKIAYAQSLIAQVDILQQLHFIHSDISADNIFIHLYKPQITLIDFDSGSILKNNVKPTTWGKPNEWVEPQIMFDLARQQGKKMPLVSVGIASDVWSTHIGLHYLLLLAHPFFFIHTLSEKNMHIYFEHYAWPEAYQGKCDTIFLPDFRQKYESYLYFLHNVLPEPIFKGFQQTFNEGFFYPEKRTSISQWKQILQEYTTPKISYRLPSPVVVKKTDYPPLKPPKLRPSYSKKPRFQPQRKTFYPKYHQKTSFLQLSYISSLKTLPTANAISTSQVIKIFLLNMLLIGVVFGMIHLWQAAHKNKWIEKFKNIQPITYDTTQIQGKNTVLKKEYETYTRYEKEADTLHQFIYNLKKFSAQEKEKLYQKSTQILSQIQHRDDSLFKIMLRYRGKPESLYVSYQKWLRSYNTLVKYQKEVDSLKKILKK